MGRGAFDECPCTCFGRAGGTTNAAPQTDRHLGQQCLAKNYRQLIGPGWCGELFEPWQIVLRTESTSVMDVSSCVCVPAHSQGDAAHAVVGRVKRASEYGPHIGAAFCVGDPTSVLSFSL